MTFEYFTTTTRKLSSTCGIQTIDFIVFMQSIVLGELHTVCETSFAFGSFSFFYSSSGRIFGPGGRLGKDQGRSFRNIWNHQRAFSRCLSDISSVCPKGEEKHLSASNTCDHCGSRTALGLQNVRNAYYFCHFVFPLLQQNFSWDLCSNVCL